MSYFIQNAIQVTFDSECRFLDKKYISITKPQLNDHISLATIYQMISGSSSDSIDACACCMLGLLFIANAINKQLNIKKQWHRSSVASLPG